MTWCSTVTGGVIELVRPIAAQVDFRNMAIALSQTKRFCGQSPVEVSVAQHLIIGCDIAPPELRPWWLLHDGHEERLGDMTTPAKETLVAIAREMHGEVGAAIVEGVRKEAERRHDAAIYAAAGLPLPSPAQQIEIKRVDLITLATEKRDFLAPQERPWGIDERRVQPHSKAYRPLPAAKAAEQLFLLFSRYLPALAGSSGRAA